jgi:hypothetical protein
MIYINKVKLWVKTKRPPYNWQYNLFSEILSFGNNSNRNPAADGAHL